MLNNFIEKIKNSLTSKPKSISKPKHPTPETSTIPQTDSKQTTTQDTIPPKHTIVIAPLSAFKSTLAVIAAIALALGIFQISNIIILFLLSFLISAALDPFVDFLQTKKIPRALSVIMIYILAFFILALIFSQFLPAIAKQLIDLATLVGKLVQEIPQYDLANIPLLQQFKPYIEQLYQTIDIKTVADQLKQFLELISSQILSWGNNLWNVFMVVSNGLMNLILLLIIVFFMTVDERGVEEMLVSVFPNKYSNYIHQKLFLIKQTIGYWIRGQVNVSVAATLLSFVALSIAGVEYALTLSLISGLCMIIPVFGRVFAFILAIPIVMNQTPFLLIWLSISYFIIAQIENNILVPYFMNKAVGLHPLVITFALLVGSQFLGILGLIIAIPAATIIAIFVKDYTDKLKL